METTQKKAKKQVGGRNDSGRNVFIELEAKAHVWRTVSKKAKIQSCKEDLKGQTSILKETGKLHRLFK